MKKEINSQIAANIQQSAEVLFAATGNKSNNEFEGAVLKNSCLNQLMFSYANNADFEDGILIPDSPFYKEQVRLILMKIKLIDKDRKNIGKNGLNPADQRSIVACSMLNLYKEFNSPYSKGDPRASLVPDLLDKTIDQGIGIVRMLNLGLFTEAFGSWRTFHESICIIKLLIHGGEKTRTIYLKHIVYSNAFRGGVENEEERNRIFDVMKSEMREHELKSKDMKKYIEYGWLYSLNSFDQKNSDFKLNFRDGIQRCAGYRDYAEWYEAASELSHSSAIFFYSESEYFNNLTIHGFYDMLGALDEVICGYYKKVIENFDDNMMLNFNLLENEFHAMVLEQKNNFNDTYFDGEEPSVDK